MDVKTTLVTKSLNMPTFPPVAVVPVLTDFTWSKQDSGVTGTQKTMGVLVDCPINKVGILLKTLSPTSNYQAQLSMRFAAILANYCSAGMYLRQTSDGKGISFVRMYDGGSGGFVYSVAQFNSGWSWYANKQFRAMSAYSFYGDDLVMRIRDDGSTRYYELSPDGETWVTHYSEGRTTWITPDQVGFGAGSASATYALQAFFTHFKIA